MFIRKSNSPSIIKSSKIYINNMIWYHLHTTHYYNIPNVIKSKSLLDSNSNFKKLFSIVPEFSIIPKLVENQVLKLKKPTYKNADYYDFRILQSPHDVENVIYKFGEKITITHLIAALNRLKQFNNPIDNRFLNHISETVISKLNNFYAKDIAIAFHAMAKLKFNNKEFFENISKVAIKYNYLSAYTPVDLSNLVHAIGILQKQHEQNLGMKIIPSLEIGNIQRNDVFEMKNELCNALAKDTLISLHPSRLNEVQLSSIIYGFGLAKFNNIEDINNLLTLATSCDRIKRFTTRELVNMLYGLALMKINKSEFLNPIIMELIIQKRLEEMKQLELMSMMYSLRLLNFNQRDILLKICHEITKPTKIQKLSEQCLSLILTNLRFMDIYDQQVIGPILSEISSDRILKVMKPQGICMCLYNMAVMGYRDNEIIEKLVKKGMQDEVVSQMQPRDLSNLIFGLSTLRYRNFNELDPLKVVLSKTDIIRYFTPSQITNLMYGSAKLRLSSAMPSAIEEILKPHKLSSLTTGNLVNVIYGLGQSKSSDIVAIQRVIDELSKDEILNRLTSNQLFTIIYSLGKLTYKNTSVITTFLKEACKPEKIKYASDLPISSAIYGLSQIAYRESTVLGTFLKEVVKPSRIVEYDDWKLSLTIYALGKIGVEDSRVIKPLLDEISKGNRIEEMTIHSITNVLYGLSQLDQFEEVLWEKLAVEIGKPHRLKEMKSVELSLILYSFGMKRFDRPSIRAILKEAVTPEKLEEYSLEGLSSTIYSLAQLEITDHIAIKKLIDKFCNEEMLPKASCHQISNVLFSLGVFLFKDKPTIRALKNELMKPDRIEMFPRRALYNSIFGFGRLRYRNLALLEKIWKEILKIEKLIGFTEREWATIAYYLHILEFKNEEDVLRLKNDILNSRGIVNLPDKNERKMEYTFEDIEKMRQYGEEKAEEMDNDKLYQKYLENKKIEFTDFRTKFYNEQNSVRTLTDKYNEHKPKPTLYTTTQPKYGHRNKQYFENFNKKPSLNDKAKVHVNAICNLKQKKFANKNKNRGMIIFNQSNKNRGIIDDNNLNNELNNKSYQSPWVSKFPYKNFEIEPISVQKTREEKIGVEEMKLHWREVDMRHEQIFKGMDWKSQKEKMNDIEKTSIKKSPRKVKKKESLYDLMKVKRREVKAKDMEIMDKMADGISDVVKNFSD